MDTLIDKNINMDFSDEIQNIFNILSFNKKNLVIAGTSKLKNLLYYSDFDLFEQVNFNKKSSSKLKSIIKNLLKIGDLHFTDIKLGKISKYEVIDNSNNIDREKLKYLLDDNIINENDYKKYLSLIDNLNLKNFLILKDELKYHTIRLKPRELLKLKNSEIEELILSGGIVKLDFIFFIEGWKFSEFSIIYDFLLNGEQLNKSTLDFQESIKVDINKYFNDKNYFKMAKRIFSLKVYKNENIDKFINLFNSSIGLLSNIKSLISTLILLLETDKKLSYDKLEFQISNFKNKLSNVIIPSYLKNNVVINNFLNKILELPNKPNKKYLKYLSKLENFLNDIIQKETKKYLNSINILPLSKNFKLSI
jgi:hypothetical protein